MRIPEGLTWQTEGIGYLTIQSRAIEPGCGRCSNEFPLPRPTVFGQGQPCGILERIKVSRVVTADTRKGESRFRNQ